MARRAPPSRRGRSSNAKHGAPLTTSHHCVARHGYSSNSKHGAPLPPSYHDVADGTFVPDGIQEDGQEHVFYTSEGGGGFRRLVPDGYANGTESFWGVLSGDGQMAAFHSDMPYPEASAAAKENCLWLWRALKRKEAAKRRAQIIKKLQRRGDSLFNSISSTWTRREQGEQRRKHMMMGTSSSKSGTDAGGGI